MLIGDILTNNIVQLFKRKLMLDNNVQCVTGNSTFFLHNRILSIPKARQVIDPAGFWDFVIYFSCGWSSGGALRLMMICASLGSRPSSALAWAICSARPTGRPFSSSGPV